MNIWSSIYEDNVKTSKQCLDPFMKGEHVHLKRGLWKEIWSHVSIKATYMKINKGLEGIIGQKTNFRSIPIWINSHKLFSEILAELEGLRNKVKKDKSKYKEEGKGRIKSDIEDRKKIYTTFRMVS